jgi:hypothetical protein
VLDLLNAQIEVLSKGMGGVGAVMFYPDGSRTALREEFWQALGLSYRAVASLFRLFQKKQLFKALVLQSGLAITSLPRLLTNELEPYSKTSFREA